MFKFRQLMLAAATLLAFSSCDPISRFTYQIKNETNEPIDVLIVRYVTDTFSHRYERRLPSQSFEPFLEFSDIGGAGSNSELYFPEGNFNGDPRDTFLIINANGDTLQKNHVDFANWRAEAVRNGRYYDHIYTFPVLDSDF
jgi:hypothetical protein